MEQTITKIETSLQQAMSITSRMDRYDPGNPDLIAVYDCVESALRKVRELRKL